MNGQPLTLLPDRVAIGQTDTAGRVYPTLEFVRLLAGLHTRMGGTLGMGTDDLATDAVFSSAVPLGALLDQAAGDLEARLSVMLAQFAQVVELRKAVSDLENSGTDHPVLAAQIAELRKAASDLEIAGVFVAPPTDWEHPGKIGASTANSGKFTTLQALTLNKMTFTQPATGATWTLADGKTLTVANTLTLTATDGATLNIGGGGTLASAAYQSASAFAARTNTALAPAATDPASTQTLANSLRSALLSVGIGS